MSQSCDTVLCHSHNNNKNLPATVQYSSEWPGNTSQAQEAASVCPTTAQGEWSLFEPSWGYSKFRCSNISTMSNPEVPFPCSPFPHPAPHPSEPPVYSLRGWRGRDTGSVMNIKMRRTQKSTLVHTACESCRQDGRGWMPSIGL